MPFKGKFPTEKFITAHVGCSAKLWKDLKMRFLNSDGPIRCLAVLQHEEIADERLWTFKVGVLTESRPEIQSASHCFLGPVVEIVAERGANLRLRFNNGDQRPLADNKKIPFLGGPEEAWQLDSPFPEDESFGYPSLFDEVGEEINETVHLRTAGYGATQALVGLSRLPLFAALGGSSLPELSHRLGSTSAHVLLDVLLIHDQSVPFILLFFHWPTTRLTGGVLRAVQCSRRFGCLSFLKILHDLRPIVLPFIGELRGRESPFPVVGPVCRMFEAGKANCLLCRDPELGTFVLLG